MNSFDQFDSLLSNDLCHIFFAFTFVFIVFEFIIFEFFKFTDNFIRKFKKFKILHFNWKHYIKFVSNYIVIKHFEKLIFLWIHISSLQLFTCNMVKQNDLILSNTFENFALLLKFKSIDLIVKFKFSSEKSKFESCALNEKNQWNFWVRNSIKRL